MIELTMTEAEHILDVLEEIQKDPEAQDNAKEEIEQAVEILSSSLANHHSEKSHG